MNSVPLLTLLSLSLAWKSPTAESTTIGSGCLFEKLPEWNKRRVCNSEDSPSVVQEGICRVPSTNYMEVRIDSQAWLTPLLDAWLVQILLSELLDVPTSIETGDPTIHLNFYKDTTNATTSIEFSQGADQWQLFERSHELKGECLAAYRSPDNYQECGHVALEVWSVDVEWLQPLIEQDVIKRPLDLGVSGQEGWYIPRATAEKDPSLLNYLGLQGETNRPKLAELFHRPMTYGAYCSDISTNNCQTANNIAQRPPQDESEGGRYFVEGMYSGHFQPSILNNCTATPNCTGSSADFVYNGFSLMPQIAHHLGIALESNGPEDGGYSISALEEIYRAANATKSDVVMLWHRPDVLHENFMETDYQLMRVTLPQPTQECVSHRYNPEVDEHRYGQPEGACDYDSNSLKKLISSSLYEATYHSNIPEPIQSPAYEALSLFQLSETQLNDVLKYYNDNDDDNPRDAVCEWVVDNLEILQSFVPPTYPRVVVESTQQSTPLFCIAIVVSSITILSVLVTAGLVYQQRDRRVMKFAQVEFLGLTLLGLLLVSLAGLMFALPPSTGTCNLLVWFANLGYTLALFPLLVKVAAITRLMNASKKMKRVVLERHKLYRAVAIVLFCVTIYMILWTALDAPAVTPSFYLTSMTDEDGSIIVESVYGCDSQHTFWLIIGIGWNILMLIASVVLAIQMRGIRQEFNETWQLANMTYLHFVGTLLVLGAFVVVFDDSLGQGHRRTLIYVLSLVYSLDTLGSLGIYFVPKLLTSDAQSLERSHRQSHMSTKSNEIRLPQFAPVQPPDPYNLCKRLGIEHEEPAARCPHCNADQEALSVLLRCGSCEAQVECVPLVAPNSSKPDMSFPVRDPNVPSTEVTIAE